MTPNIKPFVLFKLQIQVCLNAKREFHIWRISLLGTPRGCLPSRRSKNIAPWVNYFIDTVPLWYVLLASDCHNVMRIPVKKITMGHKSPWSISISYTATSLCGEKNTIIWTILLVTKTTKRWQSLRILCGFFGYQTHLFQYKQQFLLPILVLPRCIPRCLRYALPVNIMQILTEVIYATPLWLMHCQYVM